MIHLHVHSQYSICDSLIKIPELIQKVKALGMAAVALTDHGCISGALEFYLECRKENIKSILGMEAYIVNNHKVKDKDEKRRHIILLAQNKEGYRNLVKLASVAGTEGFYYVPRVDLLLLKKFSKGLIALSACSESSVLYLKGDDKIENVAKLLDRIFEGRFFLEMMPFDWKPQKEHNIMLCELSKKLNIHRLIMTQDVHFLEREDKEIHDYLMKIQGREPYEVEDLFLGTSNGVFDMVIAQKYLAPGDVAEAISNTNISIDIEKYEIELGVLQYPKFSIDRRE